MILKIKEMFLIFFGLLFIGYIFYRRVIKERIPHNITFEFNTLGFISITICILLLSLTLIKDVIKLLSIEIPLNNSWISKKLIEIFSILQKALDKNIEILLKFSIIKHMIFFLSNLAMPLSQYLKWIYYFGILVPKAIIAVLLFLDVYIFNYFHYFYKALPILLLPLFINVIIYIFYFWAEQLRQEVKKYITIETLHEDTFINTNEPYIIIDSTSEDIKKKICRYQKNIPATEQNFEYLSIYVEMYMLSMYLFSFEFSFKENSKKCWIIVIHCIINMLLIVTWIYYVIKMFI
jgi:hypothetical protein